MDEGAWETHRAWDPLAFGTSLAMEHEGGGLNAVLPDGAATTGMWLVHTHSRPAPSAWQKVCGKVEAV